MTLNSLPRVWYIPLVLILLSSAFQAFGLVEALRFESALITQGQWWRIITGNLVHLTWPHLLLNGMGILMVWYFFAPDFSERQWWLLIIISGLGVSAGLLLIDTHVAWYVGLSGLLHGLFIAGGMRIWRSETLFASLLLGMFVAKLAWEQLFGPMPGTAGMAGGPVLVNSHLYGAISGTLCAALIFLTEKTPRQPATKT